MHLLPERKPSRIIEWKQHLLPHCSRAECTTSSGWSGVLHHDSGVRLNQQDWFCSPACLEGALRDRLLSSFEHESGPAPVRTTMPLGLMLFARGAISNLELRAALDLQQATGERIGACLMRLSSISSGDIASVVATQWGCPVFPADSIQPACSMLLPFSLVERYRMLPVHLVALGRRLFVGFCEKVNHTALIAIEQMLGCETEPCVIPEPKFHQMLDYRKLDTRGEVAVTRPETASEAARMIRSYVQQTAAEAVRVYALEGNIWARLLFRHSHLDLVFVHPPA
jgi:hypothetical protein